MEAILKILGLGPKAYFTDGWNLWVPRLPLSLSLYMVARWLIPSSKIDGSPFLN